MTQTGRSILRRYRDAAPRTRLFLDVRWRYTPYESMAACLPAEGRILDLGSGHGLLSMALALGGSGRTIQGIDHDQARVELASRAAEGLGNLRFAAGDFQGFDSNPEWRDAAWNGVALIDSVHYLTFEAQERLLRKIHASLKSGGVFLMREVDQEGGFLFQLNQLHEKVATRLGLTQAEELHFRKRSEWLELLRRTGFSAEAEKCSRFPFADVLYTCRKP